MPFLTEELYQNLVRSIDADMPESVHMVDWPKYNPDQIDLKLNADMALVMRLVSLGHAARNQAEIKVRQPLSRIAFSVGSAQESKVIDAYADVFADELNVKAVGTLGTAGEAVEYSLKPLPRQLGSKYQSKFPQVREEILSLDAGEAAENLLAEQPVEIELDGERLEILPDEVEVVVEAKTGLTVAQEGAYLAALSTELTPELISEGLAREFVRRVQDFRKQSELDIADRIRLYYQASDRLSEAIAIHREYIMGETLTLEMRSGEIPEQALAPDELYSFDGEQVRLGLEVAS